MYDSLVSTVGCAIIEFYHNGFNSTSIEVLLQLKPVLGYMNNKIWMGELKVC